MAAPRKTPTGKWRVEFTIDGETHRKTFPRKKDAVAYEQQARTDHARGVFIPPDRTREKVADRLDAWLELKQPKLADKTYTLYELFVRRHIKPHLGRYTMEGLSAEVVQNWCNDLERDQSSAVAVKAHAILSSFLGTQVRHRYIPFNVAREIEDPPQHRAREKTVLEPHELHALVEALAGKPCSRVDEFGNSHRMDPDHPDWELRSGWASDVVLGLAFIGCRFGDLSRLTEAHWDRRSNRLRIDDQKTGKTRHLPVFPAVEEVLLRCVARGGEFLFMSDGRKGQHFLWPAFNHDHFKPALKAAGISRKFTPHDLRHTCASWLHKQGYGAVQIAAYLGHSSPNVTLRVYSHLFADDMQDMGEALDQMWQVAQQSKVTRIDRKAQ